MLPVTNIVKLQCVFEELKDTWVGDEACELVSRLRDKYSSRYYGFHDLCTFSQACAYRTCCGFVRTNTLSVLIKKYLRAGLFVTLSLCRGAASTSIRGRVPGYTLAYRAIVIGRKFPIITAHFSHVETRNHVENIRKSLVCWKGPGGMQWSEKCFGLILANFFGSSTNLPKWLSFQNDKKMKLPHQAPP